VSVTALSNPPAAPPDQLLVLATVLDIASRRVVGYALADHPRTELVSAALANALAARDGREAALGASTAGGGEAARRSWVVVFLPGLALMSAGTVMVCWVQQTWGCSEGCRIWGTCVG
jgi:transposase InsO family protein